MRAPRLITVFFYKNKRKNHENRGVTFLRHHRNTPLQRVCSFDVEGLLTDVSLDETLKTLANETNVYENKNLRT